MKTLLIILAVIGGIIGLIFLGLLFASIRRRPKFTKKGFTPLEKTLLSALFDLFEKEVSDKLKKQIAYFESQQKWRQYWEKSMSLELYSNNKNPLADTFRYNRKDESKLATIQFKVNGEKYFIEFNNYQGRLWGWNIRPNPKSIINQTSIQFTSKKINTDPNSFAPTTFKKEKTVTIPKFTGWLTQLDNIKESFLPMDSKNRNTFINQIDSKLPKGYLELVKQTEGLELEQFRILGISEIYTTGLGDGNYYHLAELDNGILAIKEGEKTEKIYHCYYSGLIEELSTDFEKEIMEILKNQ